jgi:hypothetical protein
MHWLIQANVMVSNNQIQKTGAGGICYTKTYARF